MSERQATVPDGYRAIKAVTFVLALLLMVPGVEVLLHLSGGRSSPTLGTTRIDSGELTVPADPYASLERIEELAETAGEEVPEAFASEIGFPPGASDIRVDETGTVVGYTAQADADSALGALKDHVESLGWTAVSLGGEEGATFVKPSGACRWALATCTQVGSMTSVVVRCMYV